MKRIVNQELSLYILWGVITSGLNIGLFALLQLIISNYKIANIITLIVVKIIAYFCNKYFVFKVKEKSIKEFFKYVLARLFTLLIDYIGLIVLIDYICIPKIISKTIIVFLVVIINYIFSKYYVFNSKIVK